MKHALLALNLCLAALLATAPARAAPRDISAEIAAQRSEFVSARLYHQPDSGPPAKEEDFAKECFIPASGDDLSALLDILINGGLHEAPPNSDGFDMRTAIYLVRRDGSTVPLLLDTRYAEASSYHQSHGSYERRIPISTNGAFSTALRAWSYPRTVIHPETHQPCISRVEVTAIR